MAYPIASAIGNGTEGRWSPFHLSASGLGRAVADIGRVAASPAVRRSGAGSLATTRRCQLWICDNGHGFAIQLAAHAGLKVLTSFSENNADYVRDLGAEIAIDYLTGNLKEVVLAVTGGRGVDAILSSLGSEMTTQDLDLLAFNGGLACLLGIPDLSLQPFTCAPSIHEVALGSAHLSGDKRAQDDLARMVDELAALIIQGAVHPPPIEVIPWQEIPAGLDRLADGHIRGRTVAQVRTN